MRIQVCHRTVYSYDQPIAYAIQTLRVQPQPYAGLRLNTWTVAGEGRKPLTGFVDGYGNWIHCHTVNRHHDRSAVTVSGEVETTDTHGVVAGTAEPLPPAFYLRATPLTAATPTVTAFAGEAAGNGKPLDRLHALMGLINDRIDYQLGATDVHTPAPDVLDRRAGVCQDHAHLFIACARALDHPARYVSGYLWTGDEDATFTAGHAWAEAYVDDLGWVGFDPANGVCPTEAYVRTAVGLDYWTAAPMRGVWRGAATETLAVEVQIQQAQAAQ